MRHIVLFSLLVILISNCKGDESTASPRIHDAPSQVQDSKRSKTVDAPIKSSVPVTEQSALELVEAMERLSKLHHDYLFDCARLAFVLDAFATKHRDLLARQNLEIHACIDAHEPLRTRLGIAMGEVMTGAMRCREDAAMQAFYAKLRAT